MNTSTHKLVLASTWAIILMFLTGMMTITVVIIDGNGIDVLWHDGATLKTAMVVYWVLVVIMMVYLMSLQSHLGYLLVPTFPGLFFISVDPPPPQSLVYCLMLLYLGVVVYLIMQEREHYVPEH
jgi:hypothetical protein